MAQATVADFEPPVALTPAGASGTVATGSTGGSGSSGSGVTGVTGPVKSSRFAVPCVAPRTASAVAEVARALAMSAGVAAGFADRSRTAAPATCGAAMEVPDSVAVAVEDVYQALGMLTPGA